MQHREFHQFEKIMSHNCYVTKTKMNE